MTKQSPGRQQLWQCHQELLKRGLKLRDAVEDFWQWSLAIAFANWDNTIQPQAYHYPFHRVHYFCQGSRHSIFSVQDTKPVAWYRLAWPEMFRIEIKDFFKYRSHVYGTLYRYEYNHIVLLYITYLDSQERWEEVLFRESATACWETKFRAKHCLNSAPAI